LHVFSAVVAVHRSSVGKRLAYDEVELVPVEFDLGRRDQADVDRAPSGRQLAVQQPVVVCRRSGSQPVLTTSRSRSLCSCTRSTISSSGVPSGLMYSQSSFVGSCPGRQLLFCRCSSDLSGVVSIAASSTARAYQTTARTS
jgi:hypothetical protein